MRGYKIVITDEAKQALLGRFEADRGVLSDDELLDKLCIDPPHLRDHSLPCFACGAHWFERTVMHDEACLYLLWQEYRDAERRNAE